MRRVGWGLLAVIAGGLATLSLAGCTVGGFQAKPFEMPQKDQTKFPGDYGIWIQRQWKW